MKTLLLTSLLLLTACGGGGAGDSTPNYSGTWYGSAYLDVDTCNLGMTRHISWRHVITQHDDNIVLTANETFFGEVADNGMTATRCTYEDGCNTCGTIHYGPISDNRADATFEAVAHCGAVSCRARYGGTVER